MNSSYYFRPITDSSNSPIVAGEASGSGGVGGDNPSGNNKDKAPNGDKPTLPPLPPESPVDQFDFNLGHRSHIGHGNGNGKESKELLLGTKSSPSDDFKIKSPLREEMMHEDLHEDSPSTPSSQHSNVIVNLQDIKPLSKTQSNLADQAGLHGPGHHLLQSVGATGVGGGARICLKSINASMPPPMMPISTKVYKKIPSHGGQQQQHRILHHPHQHSHLSSSNNNETGSCFLTSEEDEDDDEEIEEGEPNTSEEDVNGGHHGHGKMVDQQTGSGLTAHERLRIPPRPPPRKSSSTSSQGRGGPGQDLQFTSKNFYHRDQLNDGDDEEEDLEEDIDVELDDDDDLEDDDEEEDDERHCIVGNGRSHSNQNNGHARTGVVWAQGTLGGGNGQPRQSVSNGSIRDIRGVHGGGDGRGSAAGHNTQPTTPTTMTRIQRANNYFYGTNRSVVSSGAASLSGRIGDPLYGYTQQQEQRFMFANAANRANMQMLADDVLELDANGDQSQLTEIKNQLNELSKSVEVVEKEVTDVKISMNMMRNEVGMVHQCRDEIDDLRDSIERIDEDNSRNFRLLTENLQTSSTNKLLEQGLTLFLSFSIFSAVLGMLQFGYNTGVINAPQKDIQKFMKEVFENRHMSPDGTSSLDEAPKQSLIDIDGTIDKLYSIVVAIFAIGGMLGGFSGGIIANKFGRKGGLLLNNLIGIAGGLLMGLTKEFRSYEVLILGRFIIGVNCGLNTSLVPMYVSEVAPINLRGALGTVNQLAVTIGLFISQVLGIEQLLGTEDGWHFLLGLAVVPAVLQMLLLPFCPESPRYLLITKEKEEEARKALFKFRASNNVEEDIEEMRAEQVSQMSEASISMLQLIRSSKLRLPLVIAIVMQLSQQLSGINAVFYYSTDLFISLAGLEESHAKFATPGIGLIMVGMTLVSIMLMDRAGRRTLHLYGLGGMFIFSIFITIAILIKEIHNWVSYLAVVFTLSFVVFFAVGPGSIPWMITAELFSQGPRPAAMSLAVLTNWFANFLIGIFFPMLKNYLRNYVFLPFSLLLAFFWVFTYKKVPETKNKTFEEIASLFRKKGAVASDKNKPEVNSFPIQRDDEPETLPIRIIHASSTSNVNIPSTGQNKSQKNSLGYGTNLPSTSI